MQIRSATIRDAGRCAEIYASFVSESWVSFEQQPPDRAEMENRIDQALKSYAWMARCALDAAFVMN